MTQIFPLIRVVDTLADLHPKMSMKRFASLKSTLKLAAIVLAAVLLLAPWAQAQFYEWSAGPLQASKLNTVAFKGWLPERSEPLRGTLLLIPGRHGDGRGMAGDAAWQGLANDIGFAIIACQFADGDPFLYQGDPQGEVSKCINSAAEHLATESKHPELAKAPLAFWGMSAGSNVSECYCSKFPQRVAAFVSSSGTRGPGGLVPGKAEIPMFFAEGAKDKPEWVKDSLKNIEAGTRLRAPWTLAFQKNEGHGTPRSKAASIQFLKSAVNMRFTPPPAGGATPSIFKSQLPTFSHSSPSTASAPAQLHKIDLQSGWLGDPETYEVASYGNFKGNKGKGIWLPDEATANAWREYLAQ